jgi:hypothetical protein
VRSYTGGLGSLTPWQRDNAMTATEDTPFTAVATLKNLATARERVGTPGGDDDGEEEVDAWPVLPHGRPDDHVTDSRQARGTGVIYLYRPATRW